MQPIQFVLEVAGINKTDECPKCLGKVDENGFCTECGYGSDPASYAHLAELLNEIIDKARAVLLDYGQIRAIVQDRTIN